MKNKGRKQKAGNGEVDFVGAGNCKGALTMITRDVRKMNKSPFGTIGKSRKFIKKSWSKRVRGYFKSQSKDLFDESN